MTPKKLATLLAVTVMVGQASLLPALFAQAAPQSPQSPDSLQVASVIQHSDTDESDTALPIDGKQEQAPATPDVYTVNMGEDKAPLTLQVVKQDDGSALLKVGDTDVMRFRGVVADIAAYDRAKIVADRLNRMLVTSAETMHTAKPAYAGKQAVVQIGDETLATVDAETAKTAKLSPERLAFLWTNRLREALGETSLAAKDFQKFTASSVSYKSTGRMLSGMASWYGPGFHGRRTASGARFNMYALTAAHRSLPFGTLLRVTNQRNKRSCVVKVNDRGPYAHGRILDLSKGAARAIGISGVARVTLEVVNRG